MGIVEKEGSLPVFDNDNFFFFFFCQLLKFFFFFFLPTTEIITRLGGKIGANLPTMKGLMTRVTVTIHLGTHGKYMINP